ncbi:MAG: ATP-binding protein [Atopobiaceae bacterium]|jgi:signal transduction histidine kinase/AmiR/NasT family two-component response regulator|nr:ATP-binding protein [Atopobiaceae bacterium]
MSSPSASRATEGTGRRRLRNLSIPAAGLILLSVVVMSGMLFILNQSNQRSAALDQMETNRAYCEQAINDFSNASDYLTNEVWQYAMDGDPAHLSNYWNDVDVARTRDAAIQKLLHSDLSDQEATHVMRAKAYSDSLLVSETWAMRMLAEGFGLDEPSMPAEVRAYKLTSTDEALSPDDKIASARAFLYGTSYEQSKQTIRGTVQSFHADLTARMEASASASLETGGRMSAIATVAAIVLTIALVIAVVVYSRSMGRKNSELEGALAQARAASEAKSYFTSRMSHEIRTPLNAVMGYLSLAKDEERPERKDEDLAKCDMAAQNLLNIVNDVLDLSAVENMRMKLAHDPFSLAALLTNLEVVYSTQASTKGVTLVVAERDVSCDALMGDRMRLNQILTNLLSNALKFTPEGGSVTLQVTQGSADAAGGAGAASEGIARRVPLTFSVTDTGIGMSEDFLPHVFEPYEQADAEIGQKFGGTGLGLSIVKKMAEMMGGTVLATSELGHGSTFTVSLPFDEASAEQAAQLEDASRERAEKPGGAGVKAARKLQLAGMRLLLAEDNLMNSEIAQEILRRNGAEVDTAENGQEAVDAFCSSAPGTYDAILMDIQMPRMDGYEATAAIRNSTHTDAQAIPVIAMTANAFQEDVRRALDAGMNAHTPKPLDVPQMLDTIEGLVAEFRSQEPGSPAGETTEAASRIE